MKKEKKIGLMSLRTISDSIYRGYYYQELSWGERS